METPRHENNDVPAFIRKLMPDADDAGLKEAHQTVKDYIDIVIRIFERVAREKVAADSQELQPHSRIRAE